MHRLNIKRALWVESALDAFRAEVGLDALADTVSDLVTDLGHLCDMKDKDFLVLMAKGIADWKLEQTDPESIDVRPAVRIEVAP